MLVCCPWCYSNDEMELIGKWIENYMMAFPHRKGFYIVILFLQAEMAKLSMEEHRLDDQIRLHGWFPFTAVNVAVLNLLDNADSLIHLQRNAGEIERFEWRWEQSKVKPLDPNPVFCKLMSAGVYLSNKCSYSSSKNFRWLFVSEDDIKSLPCFQVSLIVCFTYLTAMISFFSLNTDLHGVFVIFNWIFWCCLYQNETLIAIKAPHGTTLEVPDPDEVTRQKKNLKRKERSSLSHFMFFMLKQKLLREQQAVDYPQRRYRIILRSTMGPIDVYLVRYDFLLVSTYINSYYLLTNQWFTCCHGSDIWISYMWCIFLSFSSFILNFSPSFLQSIWGEFWGDE